MHGNIKLSLIFNLIKIVCYIANYNNVICNNSIIILLFIILCNKITSLSDEIIYFTIKFYSESNLE